MIFSDTHPLFSPQRVLKKGTDWRALGQKFLSLHFPLPSLPPPFLSPPLSPPSLFPSLPSFPVPPLSPSPPLPFLPPSSLLSFFSQCWNSGSCTARPSITELYSPAPGWFSCLMYYINSATWYFLLHFLSHCPVIVEFNLVPVFYRHKNDSAVVIIWLWISCFLTALKQY